MRKEDEIKQLREELAYAMEHIENERSLQTIEKLTAELERLESVADEFDVEKEKAEFFQEYLPLAEKEYRQAEVQREKNRKNKIRLGRGLRAAVVLIAVFFCINGATVAVANMNILEALFRWDAGTLQISTEGDRMVSPVKEIDKAEIFDRKGATWAELEEEFRAEIPLVGYLVENMAIEELKYLENDYANIVFSDEEGEYLYTVQKLNRKTNRSVEKLNVPPIEFSFDGITYRIVKNRNWLTIIWQYDNQIYTIMGDFDETLAKEMVKSIRYEKETH